MSRVNNKEKYKKYDHNYYIKNKRPKTKIGQAELKIADLEAKLAESEKKNKELGKQFVEHLQKDQEFKNKQYQEDMKIINDIQQEEENTYKLRYELAGADETIAQLKQQLAEKEKLIEEYKEVVNTVREPRRLTQKEFNDLKKQQTLTAIIELEKVKELLFIESRENPIIYDMTNDIVGGAIDRNKCFKIINNQINQLKEGK